MKIDTDNKTITLNRHDIPSSHFTKDVYNVKYENVFFGNRASINRLIKEDYRVVYEHKNKTVLLIYNK